MPTTIVIHSGNKDNYFTANGRKANESVPPASGNVYELSGNLSFSTNVFMNLSAGETFNGKGFTIDMSGVSDTFNGLFTTGGSSLANGSIVKNVGVLGGTIANFSGAIIRAAHRYFTVENCYSTGNIGFSAGGIVGRAAGNSSGNCTITSCYSTGPIGNNAGGIVGRDAGNNGTCTITSCYSTGPIGQQAGGIAGRDAGNNGVCTITSCYSTGDIGSGSGGIAGRAAGNSSGNCTITSCYATGDINGEQAGGIAGFSAGNNGVCTITSCYSTGVINGTDAGGIAGAGAGRFGGTCTVSKSFSNRKDDNITNGASNGTKPMDGDFVLPQRPSTDGSLNEMLSDLSAVEWIEDPVAPKEYPLLKSFRNAPWEFEGVYVNYNSIDSNTLLLLLTFGSVTVTNIPNIKINFSFGGQTKELELPLMPLV